MSLRRNDLYSSLTIQHIKARHAAANETVDTGSSRFNIMVSASGFILAVSQHIKEHD